MSQPVIIKNKIVYGYMDKATVCRDMGREDYNDLTEAQQLNGDVYFIQGVDASAFAPTNSLWNKVGTTPLDSELPADCSNAINQLKSNLTDLQPKTTGVVTPVSSSNITASEIKVVEQGSLVYVKFYATRTSAPFGNSTIQVATLSNVNLPKEIVRFGCVSGAYAYATKNACYGAIGSDGKISIQCNNTSDTVACINVVYCTE